MDKIKIYIFTKYIGLFIGYELISSILFLYFNITIEKEIGIQILSTIAFLYFTLVGIKTYYHGVAFKKIYNETDKTKILPVLIFGLIVFIFSFFLIIKFMAISISMVVSSCLILFTNNKRELMTQKLKKIKIENAQTIFLNNILFTSIIFKLIPFLFDVYYNTLYPTFKIYLFFIVIYFFIVSFFVIYSTTKNIN
jgi:hypothetical protein